tara:strand:- start:314 stop:556 length:243 start_codon:yes stop_codon:yes gene_type:complete
MLDKIYYGLATVSLLFICLKECYNSIFKKEQDYLKVQTFESDIESNYNEYVDCYDGVPMDYNDFKKNKIINKKSISIDLQ